MISRRSSMVLVGTLLWTLQGGAAVAADKPFDLDFEKLGPGQTLRAQDNRFVPVSGAQEGMVQQAQGIDGKTTLLLSHQSEGPTIITRIGDDAFAPLSGEVVAMCDVRPVSGDHMIVCWEDSQHYTNMAAFVNFTWANDVPVIVAQGEPGRGLGKYEPGKWYRVTITMHIDAGDGAKSSYDVLVQELGGDGTAGKTLSSVQKINALGAPTYVRAGQIQSIVPKGGKAHGEFDHWSIAPAPQ